MTLPTDRFGDRLRHTRTAGALTMDELAETSGSSRTMISAYERHQSTPTITVAARLADALDVSPCWLAFGDDQRP